MAESHIKQPQPPISNSQYSPTYVSNTYVQPYQTTTNVAFTQQPQAFHSQLPQTFQSPSAHIVASTYLPTYDFATAPVRKTYQLPPIGG
jgi:hypothetical protein